MTRELRIREPANEHAGENKRELHRHLDWLKKQPQTEHVKARIRITEKMIACAEDIFR